MGGVFCKKVENGGVFLKSGPFLNAGCIKYSISIFFILHFTYLRGGAYTPNALPLPTGVRSILDVRAALLLIYRAVFLNEGRISLYYDVFL